MVIVTTMCTPPLLKWVLLRQERREAVPEAADPSLQPPSSAS
jgi:hypothetical protein